MAAKLKSIRETLEALKKSMTVGAPPMILSYSEVCEGVGFNRYWVSYLLLSSNTTERLITIPRRRKRDTSITRQASSNRLMKPMDVPMGCETRNIWSS